MEAKDFKKAVELVVKEKGISEDVIYDAMELALTAAYKKNYNSLSNVRVDINRETGDIKVYSFKTVRREDEVDEEGNLIFNPDVDLTLEEARLIVPNIEYGETIEEEVTPHDFGRVAAATAKQVVIQKIREAERNVIIETFADKKDEMMTGIANMEDENNYYIDFGKAQGILPKSECIPGEKIKMGSNIKVYVTKVENNNKGPLILLSRNHYGFVKRLFELEIPEINEGIILIYSVAREPGLRTKIAVYSENPKVDPVGSCIGEKGSRIGNILKELNGEKVDLIRYEEDDAAFIANALSPAKDVIVNIIDDKEKREALAIVNNENQSLAIGKKGINIKLASKLTKYRINVKTLDQLNAEGNEN